MKIKSLTTAAAGRGNLATLAFAGTALAQQPRTLKMQSAVPPSSTTQDAFKFFADRVDKLTARQSQDRCAAGRRGRPALRDPGCHAQEGDRWRLRHLLLVVRQERHRNAVREHAGRHFRHGCSRLHRLGLRGRRPRAMERVLSEGAEAQSGRISEHSAQPASARLVQAADQGPRRFQGHEVPPDRHRRAALCQDGHGCRQYAGG